MSVRDKVKAEALKTAARGKTAIKSNTKIVPKKETPLQLLESAIKEVDLVATLRGDIGDPLVKYTNRMGI